MIHIEKGRLLGQVYVSDRRLFLTEDNQVVEHDHPDARTLLVGKGASIPRGIAEKFGLITKTDDSKIESKATQPAENKAVQPTNNKSKPTKQKAGYETMGDDHFTEKQ